MKSFAPKPWFAPQLGEKVGNAFSDGKALK